MRLARSWPSLAQQLRSESAAEQDVGRFHVPMKDSASVSASSTARPISAVRHPGSGPSFLMTSERLAPSVSSITTHGRSSWVITSWMVTIRHLLAAGLLDVLAVSECPLVLDTTVPGAPPNAVHWDDLQLEHRFTWKAANRQSRRMGQLSGLRLVTAADRLRYVLYNPGFVRTSHQGALGETSRGLVGLLAKAFATEPEKAVRPIVDLIANPPSESLSAFMKGKQLALSTDDTDRAEADRLYTRTQLLLASLHST